MAVPGANFGGKRVGSKELRTNQYEEWAFETPRAKPRGKSRPNRARTSIGLPYIHGTSEKLARIFRAHDVGVYHRPINTIRSLLVHPKDKTPDLQKCGVVYQVTCPQCQHLYVGETGRTLATRMKDHTSHNTQSTAVGDHCREHGHVINKNNVEVLAREEGWFKRKVRHRNQDSIANHHPRPGIRPARDLQRNSTCQCHT